MNINEFAEKMKIALTDILQKETQTLLTRNGSIILVRFVGTCFIVLSIIKKIRNCFPLSPIPDFWILQRFIMQTVRLGKQLEAF